jgi:hypothetical protein
MTDIFVSYKTEERDKAERLAEALSQTGYDVWWDAALLAGSEFSTEIEEVIKEAKVVIVLWSRAALKSEWVKAEAEAGRRRGTTLSTRIDDVSPDDLPLLFKTGHVLDLSSWSGSRTDPVFKQLMAAIKAKAGPPRKSRSKEEASRQLRSHVEEAEFWQTISLSPAQDVSEYKSYLTNFGETARWADIAKARIARLEASEVAKRPTLVKSLARRTQVAIGFAAAAISVLAFFGLSDTSKIMEMFAANTGNSKLASTALPDTPEARDCAKWASPLGANNVLYTPAPNYAQSFQPALAIDRCTAALAKLPSNPVLLALRARAAVEQQDYVTAFADARQAAEAGNIDAKVTLATLNYLGKTPGASYERAFAQYKEAADQGNGLAQAYVAQMLRTGEGTAKDERAAVDYLRKSTEAGEPLAISQLAYMHYQGLADPSASKEKNQTTALDLWQKAAALGYYTAQYNLGTMFENGDGTPVQYETALKYYAMAGNQGYGKAQASAGQLYLNKLVETQGDEARRLQLAYDWLSKAAAQNETLAQVGLGYMYYNGQVASVTDPKERNRQALDLWQKAANAGSRAAQFNLGVMFRDGTATMGTDQAANDAEAVKWFRLAADQNDAAALTELGKFHLVGRGVPKDEAKAKELFQKAAAAGDANAAAELKKLP